MIKEMFKKFGAFVKEWWNKPIEKRGLIAVLLGKETLTVCLTLFVGGVLLGISLFILQLCSVEIETRENIIGAGVVIMLIYCLYLVVSAIRALDAIWKKALYLLIMPTLFSIVLSLSQLLIFIVIGGLICGILFKGFYGGAGVPIPTGDSSPATTPESSDHGKLYEGISGDYIQGNHGDDQRITQDLGGGDVLTEKGERYHIDEKGYASKR